MSKLKGRALTREDKLLPECKKAHPIYEPLFRKVFMLWIDRFVR